jgi:phenylalanyl-tRNA synthetase beta chain
MKVPLSWLKDFIRIEMPVEELARQLTLAGLEVEEIRFVGLPMPGNHGPAGEISQRQETKITGLAWDPEKIVVGAILEVMPHPNADRLVLCRLDDGQQEQIILTGAPNLYPYKGLGPLPAPIKVAYAKEGSQLFDGHQPGQVLMTLQRARIRGVESYSMACSEKELGISDDHEGVIILDESAPVGTPLSDYMGDAVLDIALTPNLARDANILGVAGEVSAITGLPLNDPDLEVPMEGQPIEGRVDIQIGEPELNPRFVLGLIEDVEIKPSPYDIQRRLRLAGMRPINNVVDATNYAMLEIGQPLHAFDYDVLVQRAGGNAPTILTRRAESGERLTTLDGVDRTLDDFTVLVCDAAGALSIAGVMGGAESEVGEQTRTILLEGAAWNYINIRRTVNAQRLSSEAAYRFSRGVHPAMAERGVRRCLQWMHRWTGGTVAKGLVDSYPLPPVDPLVSLSQADVRRWLGIDLSREEITSLLSRLEFSVQVDGERILAKTPDHRLDIGEGVIGVADVIEEIARIYGYDRIPATRMADELPVQHTHTTFETEERLRDVLANLGLQEVITYRITSAEDEQRLLPRTEPQSGESSHPAAQVYIEIANPLSSENNVLRQSLLASVLKVAERNARYQDRLALFEIGKVYLPTEDSLLPQEPRRIALLLTGPRSEPTWQESGQDPMDFYDLKGVIEGLLDHLHILGAAFESAGGPSFHPGKCASLVIQGKNVGAFGELHPLVKANYELPPHPVLAGELDLEALEAFIPNRYDINPLPVYPPVIEDLALVVDDSLPAARVEQTILEAGGEMVSEVRLFDVYRGGQAGQGKKSLAYRLTYQPSERTLTDQEVSLLRQRIIRHVEQELQARLRE